MSKIRVGQGMDAHKLVPDRKLVLAGVTIPFEKGLLGHSDSDVVAHAVMDAILGALAMGDIGTHFPPDDPAYKDADSMELLAKVVAMADEKNYSVEQVDVNVIAQAPRLMPHFEAMRNNLSQRLGTPLDAVSVKATTTEGMGFIGRGEGIAAMAVVLLSEK